MKNWLTSRVDVHRQRRAAPAGLPRGQRRGRRRHARSRSRGTGTIRYTLDGTDPRPFGGAHSGHRLPRTARR